MDPASLPTLAVASCDTLAPPTRFYSPPLPTSADGTEDVHDAQSVAATTIPFDFTGLQKDGSLEASSVHTVMEGVTSTGEHGVLTADPAKGNAPAGSWIQPPGRKLCMRHQRMADQGTNLLLQHTLDALPMSERETVSNIWASFSSSSHSRRALILQGILTMCCQSELSLLSEQVSFINRIDPFSLFPRELALKILVYVDATSLTRAAQVSRLWKSLADDDILWKNMCEQHIEKQCLKCGWGLPLLPKRAGKSGASSPTGAGGSAISNGKRRADDGLSSPSEQGAVASPSSRPLKRPRSNSPMTLDDHHAAAAASSSRAPPLARIPSSSSLLKSARVAASTSSCPITQRTLGFAPLSAPSPIPSSGLTRPWKDVYSERLTISRNWRLGRATVTALKGHTDGVMCLQFSDTLTHPSFPILITASYDCSIRVWNMTTGKEVRKMLGHTRAVRALQFDECKLVTASMDRTLRLWNWRTGECIRTLEGHAAGVVCLAFDANVLVSGSVDKTVKVWNFRTGDCFTLRGHMDWVNAVQIWDSGSGLGESAGERSSDQLPTLDPGKMVFSASDDGTIRLWDLMSKACVRTFEGHGGQVQSIQLVLVDEAAREQELSRMEEDALNLPLLSPTPIEPAAHAAHASITDGRTPILISGSLDTTVRVWDVESGKRIKTLFGHIEGVWAVACNNLRLVTGSHDKTIKIWNRDEGKCTATLVGHRGAVTCLAVGDDKIVSGSDDGDVRIWNFGAPAGAPACAAPSSSGLKMIDGR